jgi:hypothetical protein
MNNPVDLWNEFKKLGGFSKETERRQAKQVLKEYHRSCMAFEFYQSKTDPLIFYQLGQN